MEIWDCPEDFPQETVQCLDQFLCLNMLINNLGGKMCYLRDSQEVPATKLIKLYVEKSNGAVFCRQLRELGDVLSAALNNLLQWSLLMVGWSHRSSARWTARTEQNSGLRSLRQSSWRYCCKDPCNGGAHLCLESHLLSKRSDSQHNNYPVLRS